MSLSLEKLAHERQRMSTFPADAEGLDHLKNDLGRFRPAEVLLTGELWENGALREFLKELNDTEVALSTQARMVSGIRMFYKLNASLTGNCS